MAVAKITGMRGMQRFSHSISIRMKSYVSDSLKVVQQFLALHATSKRVRVTVDGGLALGNTAFTSLCGRCFDALDTLEGSQSIICYSKRLSLVHRTSDCQVLTSKNELNLLENMFRKTCNLHKGFI